MRFVIYQDRSGEWRWRLVSANHRTIADSSEGYSKRENVVRALTTLCQTFQMIADAPIVASRQMMTPIQTTRTESDERRFLSQIATTGIDAILAITK